jgi:hypothetical protein
MGYERNKERLTIPMVPQTKWPERQFSFDFPAGIFPCLLERLRGTPARLEEMTLELPQDMLTAHTEGDWSIQEHAGHFLDTEELWQKRLDDFLSGKPSLTDADLTHRKTREANHNANTIELILAQFRLERFKLADRLAQLNESDIARTSLHPRLNKPVRLIDSVYFTCEHDDHYMAILRGLLIRSGY